jgi:hypothetical protein
MSRRGQAQRGLRGFAGCFRSVIAVQSEGQFEAELSLSARLLRVILGKIPADHRITPRAPPVHVTIKPSHAVRAAPFRACRRQLPLPAGVTSTLCQVVSPTAIRELSDIGRSPGVLVTWCHRQDAVSGWPPRPHVKFGRARRATELQRSHFARSAQRGVAKGRAGSAGRTTPQFQNESTEI